MPSDPDLRANPRFARDGVEPDEPALVARVLFPLASRAASDTLLRIASALYVAIVLLAIGRRLAPPIERVAGRAAIVAAALLLVVASSAAYRLLTLQRVSVPRPRVPLRESSRSVIEIPLPTNVYSRR